MREAHGKKDWIVHEGKGIECPHCGGRAKINFRQWRSQMVTTSLRPCTYCWALNRVPNMDLAKLARKVSKGMKARK
jgi:hypothetical protein